MDRYLVAGICTLVLFVSAALAGSDPEPKAVSCHGAAAAGCHGAKTEAKGASSCHGRKQTLLQRAADRQADRKESRSERRASRSSCHGQAKAVEPDCECECN